MRSSFNILSSKIDFTLQYMQIKKENIENIDLIKL
jgi:hypothetical protein